MRIDISFDDASFHKFFHLFKSQKCKSEEISDMIKLSEAIETEDNEQSPISNKIFKKYIEKNNNEKLKFCESAEIIDIKLFLEKLKRLLDFWGETLKEDGMNGCEDYFKGKKKSFFFLKTKIWEDFNKFRIYILQENTASQNLDIHLKNGFETHGNIIFLI